MSRATTRAHVWVDGSVQGVFFRASAAEEAERLGVTGWIRNLPDGRVEAVFEGDEASVDAAVEWCRHGPERAIVTSVVVERESVEGIAGFSVR